MADSTDKWGLLRSLNLPAGLGYTIPTGGAKPNEWYERPNTYLETLGTQRAENPPVNWDDQPAQLGINPNILNDPAFSEYDLSQLRTFEQDPMLRDEMDLGIVGTKSASKFAKSPDAHGAYGFTYTPFSPYDPNKVYIRGSGELGLSNLKMAVGPGVEQTKQGNINKEIASTIAHEFRHNLLDQPEYSGIIDAAYNRFGASKNPNIDRSDLEEYINRAADAQLIPGDWDWAELNIPESLNRFQKRYHKALIRQGMPAHLTPMNTTKHFNRAAKEFFEKVRRQKLKRPTQINIQKEKMGMPQHLTPPPKQTYVAPLGPRGDGGGRPRPDKPGGFTDPGKDSYGPHKARGGLIDIPLPGRRRDI